MVLGRHKSLDKNVKRNIQWLESIEGVEKVILGFSESCRHRFSPGQLRFRIKVPGGIKINAYSGNGVTDIFVKIEPIELRDQVIQAISDKFANPS